MFLVQLFGVLLAVLWLFEKSGEKQKAFDIFTLLILIYGAVRLISIIFSDYPEESIQSLYKEALFYLAFFSIGFYLKFFPDNFTDKIVYGFSAASVVVAVIGIIKFNLDFDYRASSFSSGYMAFSTYLLAALPILIFGITLQNIDLNWLIRSIGISFILSGIITSLGRVNIAIAILVFLAGIILKKINLKEFITVTLLSIFLCSVSFYNNSFGLFGYRVSNPSILSDRDIILKGAEEVFLKFKNPLFGYGPRSFHLIFPYISELSDPRINSWHNDFIQLYFESGFFGFSSLCLLIFFPLYTGIKYLLKKPVIPHSFELIMGIVVSIAAVSFSALFSIFINSPILSLVFAFLLALQSAVFYKEGIVKELNFSKLKMGVYKWK
ncbi:MAG TPA: O-antigen ligase family protein [Ignavibacteriaceae bacterium]|nr:O-antigen ligase family protein [Ignavibacteriaceae bacterium]